MSKLGNLALLAVRLGVGGTLISHGAQKLFGAFDGPGLDGVTKGFEQMGFPEPRRAAQLAGLGETLGGASLVLGLATGAGGAGAAGTMAVAASTHAPNGFFNTDGGFEFPAVLGLVSSALALGGPGALSLDAATRNVFNKPWMRVLALAGSFGFAAYTAMSRQPPAAAPVDEPA
ncbi:DoxX family protein [Microlunatus soli]|uniref:Putative oxidoreductase n=1 Tax=Microlunatus soli TaxID=630515 RepID=A0A1H1P1L1_9ACTN|nr:DoxX family protein [Microlunatus soli]SDS05111.1 putative oxidoreductase [Microlunatus soli]